MPILLVCHSFQRGADQRPVAYPLLARDRLLVPERIPVCSFNDKYKITTCVCTAVMYVTKKWCDGSEFRSYECHLHMFVCPVWPLAHVCSTPSLFSTDLNVVGWVDGFEKQLL